MLPPSPECQYLNCEEYTDAELYHIVFDIYLYLCVGHARMLLSTRKSKTALIEFLVDSRVGKDPKARQIVRTFIIEETKRLLDGT